MEVKLMGIRGTVPVHGRDFAVFGGATSCVLVTAGEECIILDAGTGLRPEPFMRRLKKPGFSMLISHSHVDHLMGFPIFPPFFDSSLSCDVYLKTRGGLGAREQIERLMAPPLWPIRTDGFKAALSFHDVRESFDIGAVHVESMEARHPGGSSIFKLSHEGKSLVYATDFEAMETEPEFEAFAQGCSLLLLDAQYSSEEYTRTRGFGHSTYERSESLACSCRAENTLFIHHDPKRTDTQLEALDAALRQRRGNIRFGREEEEIYL